MRTGVLSIRGTAILHLSVEGAADQASVGCPKHEAEER